MRGIHDKRNKAIVCRETCLTHSKGLLSSNFVTLFIAVNYCFVNKTFSIVTNFVCISTYFDIFSLPDRFRMAINSILRVKY